MNKKVVISVLLCFMVWFLVTVSSIIHEVVHMHQAGFDYTEVCFLGRSGDLEGWVESTKFYNITDVQREAYEEEAEAISSISIILLAMLFGGYLGLMW